MGLKQLMWRMSRRRPIRKLENDDNVDDYREEDD